MADVQILNGYNVKDATARSNITSINGKLIPLNSTMATTHTLTNAEYTYLFSTVLKLGNVATLTYTEV